MGDAARMTPSEMTDVNSAEIPIDRIEQDSYDWYARHHTILELAKDSRPRVVLIRDSITQFWGGTPVSHPAHRLLSLFCISSQGI